jgi:hypothetical protein
MSMSDSNNAFVPRCIREADKYRIVAQLLRERAAQPELSREQAAKASSLADYFEALADDPTSKVTIER